MAEESKEEKNGWKMFVIINIWIERERERESAFDKNGIQWNIVGETNWRNWRIKTFNYEKCCYYCVLDNVCVCVCPCPDKAFM